MKCSNYMMNMTGHNGLVRVCKCHWMKPVVPPGIPKRERFEQWGR